MGQTLTHGVYLPDEGERNCYSGLAANWQILDGAVGTIAAHTAALSGKAPLVHTHTKSDITDFPAYGTTAGTICEGNDSRLSDARTPVAHTHTKSDVTDLLNSNFIPSANNSYDLGSSSYQWNNLYAKNYYYNGVAWGLDKANTWAGNQYYTGMMILNSSSDVVEQFRQKLPKDVSTSSDSLVRFNTLVDSAGHHVVVNAEGHWDTYVAKSITLTYKADSTKQGSIEFRLRSDGSGLLYAQSPFECDLGNAYNQWKTLNGVNPGALSLPGDTYITIDTTNFAWGSNFVFTPTVNGHLFINIGNSTGVRSLSLKTNRGEYYITNQISIMRFTVPVYENKQVIILVKSSITETEMPSLSLFPLQGNV